MDDNGPINDEADEDAMQAKFAELKTYKQVRADGMFRARNDAGSTVLLLYVDAQKLVVTIELGEDA